MIDVLFLITVASLFISFSFEKKLSKVSKKSRKKTVLTLKNNILLELTTRDLKKEVSRSSKRSCVLGYANTAEKRVVLNINVDKADVGRTLVHEMAHINFYTKRHLDLAERLLPIPTFSTHSTPELYTERIAIWFESYIFDREFVKKEHPTVEEYFDKILSW